MANNPEIPDLPDREEAKYKLLKEINEMIESDDEGNILSINVPIDVAADVIKRYIRDFMPDKDLFNILRNEPDLKDKIDEQAFIAKKTSILLNLPDGSN